MLYVRYSKNSWVCSYDVDFGQQKITVEKTVIINLTSNSNKKTDNSFEKEEKSSLESK